jgi:hypothetical protein
LFTSPSREPGPEELKPFATPAENCLRLEDQEGRAPLTPDFGEPDPEEAISLAQSRSRMSALINGQLLSEGEILQSQTVTMSEFGGEYRDEGK